MAEIRWTAEAERRLEQIYDYLAARNPGTAYRTVEGIYRKAQVLQNFPRFGHRYGEISGPMNLEDHLRAASISGAMA